MERAFAHPQAWAAWLAAHHADTPDGLWIRMAKMATGIPSVTWDEAVGEALRFGWIDGQREGLDERFFLQRFTPRRPRSRWSKINRARAEALIAEGRMEPAGRAEVERARADGRWDAAYDSPGTATVPDDLRAALDVAPQAAAVFAGLDGRNRYAVLHRIAEAKRPETRARRIAGFVDQLAAGTLPHP